MFTNDFIKGMCLELNDKSKTLTDDELRILKESSNKTNDMTSYNKALEEKNYISLHGYFIDDFIKRDDIFQRWHDCNVNHLFIQVNIKEDSRNKGHIIQQKLCSLNSDYPEEYCLYLLLDKCTKYNITPSIKLMTDVTLTLDFVNNNKDTFFQEYKQIIKYILSCDTDHHVDIITIANETELIRQYSSLKDQWKDVIDFIHTNYKNIKVSASQFCSDILNGEYDIAEYLDIIGINRYPENINWPDTPSVEEMLPDMYNDKYIFHIQEYCKFHDKKFMITECGVSHWSGQCREPSLGNTMTNFYGKGRDYVMQANYNKAALIASFNMDYCIGHAILAGADYDPIFIFNYNNPLKNVIIDNYYGFEAIKSAWGKKDVKEKKLTFWNHNSEGNPHKQYVINDSSFSITPFNFSKDKCYFKLLTVTMPDLSKDAFGFAQFEACFNVYDNSNFGGTDGDNTWELFLKIGTANSTFYKENGITVKLKGENRRCILTCKPTTIEEESRNSFIDENGLIHHEINKNQKKCYQYDLYIKMKTDIIHNTYFIKKFIDSKTSNSKTYNYTIYNKTPCNSFQELNLNNLRYFVSSNENSITFENNILHNNYRYTRLFNIDLSFNRNFYINYSGVFKIISSYSYSYKDITDCKPQFINLLITGTNTEGKKTSDAIYDLNVQLISSINYDSGNIVYTCNDDGLINFYFRSLYPPKITVFKEDNDESYRIFTLELENVPFPTIDETKLILVNKN